MPDSIVSQEARSRRRNAAEASRGLSFEQKYILKMLLTANSELWGGEAWVRWYPSKGPSAIECGWTRADSAMVSRSLRRLADRGLVERCNDITGTTRRTVVVRLTPLGETIAQRLSKTEAQNDNRCVAGGCHERDVELEPVGA